jgi:GDP/UDP-N,N'-diacetylbacillosamine 2-epimerase (hydrolysing)
MTRTVWYVTGTRADYGLMRATLRAIARHPALDLALLATGMHLDPACGETVREIEADGFPLVARIASHEPIHSGAAMARGIARMTSAFTDAMDAGRPDIVLLLGDRGEMLAAAIAAIHLDIPVVHIHGGERSGTVDEAVRHAISKLAHFHFVATEEARERLVRMGERPDAIHVVGAPGLVGLSELAGRDRVELAAEAGLDPSRPIALFVYHPVLQEAAQGGAVTLAILDALAAIGYQTVALRPNSDGGSAQIRAVLDARAGHPDIRVATHLDRGTFANWMAVADVMIGNSSAGIIEAASFGVPVVNIGSRQNLRQRNANVIDVRPERDEIHKALTGLRPGFRYPAENVYGDGKTDGRIASLLADLRLEGITWKCNAY